MKRFTHSGKRLEYLKHFFTSLLDELRFRSPAVVLLDDIDQLIPIVDENDTPDDLRSYRISEGRMI